MFRVPRLWLVLCVCILLAMPDTSIGGVFRRRCRHRRACPQSGTDGTIVVPVVGTTGCQTGSVCVQRLVAKYIGPTGACSYAVYDSIQCPFATVTHYDTKCDWSCPRYCSSSPCSCIVRDTVSKISSEAGAKEESAYTGSNALLTNGLTTKIVAEEYPGATKISEHVIELKGGKKAKIIWMKIAQGRYAGAGYLVPNDTPVSPQPVTHTDERIKLDDGTDAKAFLVHVNRIGDTKVDQDHVVIVDY